MPTTRSAAVRRATAVVGAGLLLGLAGCSNGDSATSPQSNAGFVQGTGIVVVPKAKRQQPVSLAGTTLAGDRLDLVSYRGAPVVINVWGSWCAPCRKEAPALQRASVRLAVQGVKMVGINITKDDDAASARAFEKDFGITYPSLVDDNALLLRLKGAVSPNAIPTTLVLDAQGRIAARASVPLTETTLMDLVQEATG